MNTKSVLEVLIKRYPIAEEMSFATALASDLIADTYTIEHIATNTIKSNNDLSDSEKEELQVITSKHFENDRKQMYLLIHKAYNEKRVHIKKDTVIIPYINDCETPPYGFPELSYEDRTAWQRLSIQSAKERNDICKILDIIYIKQMSTDQKIRNYGKKDSRKLLLDTIINHVLDISAYNNISSYEQKFDQNQDIEITVNDIREAYAGYLHGKDDLTLLLQNQFRHTKTQEEITFILNLLEEVADSYYFKNYYSKSKNTSYQYFPDQDHGYSLDNWIEDTNWDVFMSIGKEKTVSFRNSIPKRVFNKATTIDGEKDFDNDPQQIILDIKNSTKRILLVKSVSSISRANAEKLFRLIDQKILCENLLPSDTMIVLDCRGILPEYLKELHSKTFFA